MIPPVKFIPQLEQEENKVGESDMSLVHEKVSEEEIARITEAFYMVDKSRSRKEGGAGIGMALCQKIITLHQGELKIDSKLGEGTVMRLYFPGEMQVVKNKSNRGAKGGI